ncbi:MAG: acyl transferase [Chitinophagales bacterium]|nr:acyl transferase [Chitinophagales bacterium]MBP6155234.1 acyl transferase [Chitinophagales bacterium]
MASKIQEKIFLTTNFNFDEIALELFHFQYTYNPIYKQFVDHLKINVKNVNEIVKIPFLPIEFFKTHRIICQHAPTQKIFESSGTTGQINSKHFVSELKLYEQSFEKAFVEFYGSIEDWTFLALLPSYLERDTSSLVYMMNDLILKSKKPNSGFYLHNLADLKQQIIQTQQQANSKIMLIGVTFALLDFAEQFPMDLSKIVLMETGGMKGRRRELMREEVHQILQQAFSVSKIHSEYGMTELLSQAYSYGDGIFKSPNWMKVLKRDIYNPFFISDEKGRGGLNVIDLANIYSCAFIATQDIVHLMADNEFSVLGRIDNADIRGCNLMVTL